MLTMKIPKKNKNFLIKLNVILFLYFMVSVLITSSLESPSQSPTFFEMLFDLNELYLAIMIFIIGIVLLIFGAQIMKMFWNLVISDIFNLRSIDFLESLSIILVMQCIFISL